MPYKLSKFGWRLSAHPDGDYVLTVSGEDVQRFETREDVARVIKDLRENDLRQAVGEILG